MSLRRIAGKIVEGKNDSFVSTQNFLMIYIFLGDNSGTTFAKKREIHG
jgi:hypothetical protein